MYLITIEGGDGSGKGIATKMLEEILLEEFTFSDIWVTGEPRRDHPLGKLAVDSVRTGEAGPVKEASLFAADRLDHSHAWILPRLKQGKAVISERNVHSSLVYQGIVGKIGLTEVARLNSAACIPDLCLWVDCDPIVALRRITHGTLREAVMDKQEYFETDELQQKIRAGYATLLGGGVSMPKPFNKGVVVGPILNDGTKADLRRKIQKEVRKFLHRHPTPLNIDAEDVERVMLEKALKGERGQTTLKVLDTSPKRSSKNWLHGEKPWQVMKHANSLYQEAYAAIPDEKSRNIPKTSISHTVISVIGTLSLLPGAEASSLRKWFGPVRVVSSRHTHRMLKFFHEQSGWVRTHKPLKGKDAARSELRAEWQAFGRLGLVIWPLKEEFAKWQDENPDGQWRNSLSVIVGKNPSAEMIQAMENCVARLAILGSGMADVDPPSNVAEFRKWWRQGPVSR